MHSTNNLDDGYLGSGQRLWKSINKHGKENHSIEILEFLQDRETLKKREVEIITEDMLKDPMCMNLALGGEGGASCMSKEQLAKGGKNGPTSRKRLRKNDPEYAKKHSDNIRKSYYRAIEEGRRVPKQWGNWKGKKHTSETKEKIGKSNSIQQRGSINSQFGTMWITNGKESKKIKKDEIIPEGWKKGRRMPI